jgi:hypothetical protein
MISSSLSLGILEKFFQSHLMHKTFLLNILIGGTRPNTRLHKMILFWIFTVVSARPSVCKPRKIETSCNVSVLTQRWNVQVSHLHLSISVVSNFYILKTCNVIKPTCMMYGIIGSRSDINL